MKQLITMRLGAAGFAQHWQHCDLVANYLATFASGLLQRSEYHAILMSTVLNELLEVVFRRNAGTGQIGISLSSDDRQLVVEILVPVNETELAFYQEMAELVTRTDIAELHRQHIMQPYSDDRSLTFSLLELAANHNAVLHVQMADDGHSVLLQLPFHIDP